MEERFAPALRTLQKLLQNAAVEAGVSISLALIGGLAVSTWVAARATEDVDFLADSTPSPLRNLDLRHRLEAFLSGNDCIVEWRVGEPDDPIPLLLRLELQLPYAVTADILWAHKRWQREALDRTIGIRLSDFEVFVLHPEDLVLMKLDAGGPQDLLDVQMLLSNPPSQLDLSRLKRKATRIRMGGQLNKCLRESRRTDKT